MKTLSRILLLTTCFATPALADLDRNCTDELVLGRDAGANQRWFAFGDADADFAVQADGGDGWGIGRATLSVAVGDIDGDGRDEFVVGRDGAASQSVRVLVFDDAQAGFAQIFSIGNGWGAGRRALALALGNVDDDPALELAVGRDGPNNWRYKIYDDRDTNFATLLEGGGTWGSDRRVTAMRFGNIDNDAADELIIGRSGGAVARPRWIGIDDAAAGFSELIAGGGDWGAGRRVTAVATGDVDGDGRDEIALGRDSGPNFHWSVIDDAVGGFATLASGGDGWGSTRATSALDMGDVDGDGLDELAVGRNGGANARVLVFDDAGENFTLIRELGGSWGITRGVRALAMGDVDGDFVDEVAVGRNGGSGPRWFVYDDGLKGFGTLRDGGDGWGVGRSVTALALRSHRRSGGDRDQDGLFDTWETTGIDSDCDGSPEFILPGADPDRKNIYVEVDYMTNHEPNATAIADVVTAFLNAPTTNPDGSTGIDLQVEVDEEIPEVLDITTWGSDTDPNFDDIRDGQFGTPVERAVPEVLAAKAMAYRYALFAHQRDGGTSSGRAKPGNFVVSLGGSNWGEDASGHNVGTREQQAGTFMHELGHTLGLGHGGGDSVNCKPNYLSIMSYNFQTRLIPNPGLPEPRLDFSRSALPDLDESNLNEANGIQDGTDQTFFGGGDGSTRFIGSGSGAIDWNQDGAIGTVSEDINFTPSTRCDASPFQTLAGFDDWSNLFLPARALEGEPTDTETYPDEELTAEEAMIFEACADGEDTALCTQPPYEYAAKFVCGVQDDPATLRLVRGVYGTSVNIHNPWVEDAIFYKKVALAYPPAAQEAGDILQMGKDLLRYDEALKVDCEDIERKAFGGKPPSPYYEGFVVVQSFSSLDVTAVYTTGALQSETGCCGSEPPQVIHSGMDVVQVKERKKKRKQPDPEPDPGRADLIPERPFNPPSDGIPTQLPQNYCMAPNDGLGAADTLRIRIRNQGDDAAGAASQTRIIFTRPSTGTPVVATVNVPTPDIPAGGQFTFEQPIPRACFASSGAGCNFEIIADAGAGTVAESDESNNSDSSFCPGVVP